MRASTTCSTRKDGPAGGFTLTELLVVIAIIGILAGITYAALDSAIERAKINATRGLVGAVSTGLQMFKTDFGHLPHNASGDITNDPEFIRLWLLGIDDSGDPDNTVRDHQYWGGSAYVELSMQKNVIADYEFDDPNESFHYVIVDAWDQRLYFETYDPSLTPPPYKHRPIHNTDKWDVWSRGPDGKGTDDDAKPSGTDMSDFHGDYEQRLNGYNAYEEGGNRVNRDNIGNW